MSVAVPVIDSYDGANRRIYLKQGVDAFHWIDDIYREYVHERAITEDLRKWYPFLRAAGNDPKGGGKYTPRYVTMLEGARVIPYDENILIVVTGEAITDNADIDPDPFDTTTRTQPLKLYITPPAAEIVKDVESLAAIQHMSFNNEIWHDFNVGYTVANFPHDPGLLGNGQYPAKLQEEAHAIAVDRGINKLRMTGPHTMNQSLDWSGFLIHGDSAVTSFLDITSTPDVTNCTIRDMMVSGVLDGGIVVRDSIINGLTFFNGILHECALTVEPLVLGGVSSANLFSCYSGVPGASQRPQIDFDDQPTPLAVRNWYGGMELVNKTTEVGEVSIDMSSGIVYVRASCTAGTITVRGVGLIVDESTGTCVVDSTGLLKPDDVTLLTTMTHNKADLNSVTGRARHYADDGVTIVHEFDITEVGDTKTRTPV